MTDAIATSEPIAAPGLDPASRRMVVCHLIASNFAGGPEKQILELCAQLAGIRWHPVVGSFRENRPRVAITEAARARGLETFLIDTRSPFSPLAVRQLVGHLRRTRSDLLVTHGYKANLIGHIAARRTGTPHAATVRGYTAEDWKVRTYEKLDRRVLRRIRLIFCVSSAMRRYLTSRGIREDRTVLLPNAVRDGSDTVPLDLRGTFGFSPDSLVLIAAGRLSPEKAHRHLLDAMPTVAERRPEVRLVILGDGPERASLERRIAELGLVRHVVLAGFQEDALRHLAGADVVVNPSLSEGMPNVLLEAMSVRTPIVATDVGGVGELITSHTTGLLVPPGEPRAIADAIVETLADPSRAAAWATAAYRKVVEGHSFTSQRDRFTAACVRFVNSGSGTETPS